MDGLVLNRIPHFFGVINPKLVYVQGFRLLGDVYTDFWATRYWTGIVEPGRFLGDTLAL